MRRLNEIGDTSDSFVQAAAIMAVAVPTMAHSSIPTSLPALLQQVADKHIVLAIADVDGEMSPGSRCEPQFSTRQWVAPSCTHPGLTKAHLGLLLLLLQLFQALSQQQASNQPPSRPTSAHSPSSLIKVDF